MIRRACADAVAVVLTLAGCGGRLVDVPRERPVATVVSLPAGKLRCPADTVLAGDLDPGSGAGTVPAGFGGADLSGVTVLLCHVDYTTTVVQNGVERFTVSQWRGAATTALLTALTLPDRQLRPVVACSAATGSTTAVYLVDPDRSAVRLLLPVDDPCRRIRPEVAAVLPADGPDDTFTVGRPSR